MLCVALRAFRFLLLHLLSVLLLLALILSLSLSLSPPLSRLPRPTNPRSAVPIHQSTNAVRHSASKVYRRREMPSMRTMHAK